MNAVSQAAAANAPGESLPVSLAAEPLSRQRPALAALNRSDTVLRPIRMAAAYLNDLKILYRDDWYVAIDKPAGMIVHNNGMPNQGQPVLQTLRDQIGAWIYPVHRLDRPTSGVLIFAQSSSAARRLNQCFTERRVEKTYLATVRGYTGEGDTIDYALREDDDMELQRAVTTYRRLDTVELDIPCGRYPTARYSLVELYPETGRYHQIRKHMHHISHPIVGDTTHGDGRHNRLFRNRFDCHRLLLFATELAFDHPYTGKRLSIVAPPSPEIIGLFQSLGWQWLRRRSGTTAPVAGSCAVS